jgi:hypothetical protein
VSVEIVNRFFDNLEESLKDVPPESFMSYDETNLTDYPKTKLMIFRKRTMHAEKIMNTSKSAVSHMFACAASGQFLPPYVVCKADRLLDTLMLGGPISTRYNRTKSGWFDTHCIRDWLQRLAVPYFKHLSNDAPSHDREQSRFTYFC